jgi:hypothetical protein
MFQLNKRVKTRDFLEMMHMIINININNRLIKGHLCSEIIKVISHSIAIRTLLIKIKRKKIFHNAIIIISRLNPPNIRIQ